MYVLDPGLILTQERCPQIIYGQVPPYIPQLSKACLFRLAFGGTPAKGMSVGPSKKTTHLILVKTLWRDATAVNPGDGIK